MWPSKASYPRGLAGRSRSSGRSSAWSRHPPANGERLGESFPPGNPDGGGPPAAPIPSAATFRRSPVHDSQHGWDPKEHAQDLQPSSVALSARSTGLSIRASSGIAAPVQERQRQPVVPREHHGVALDLLEQACEDCLFEGRGAREAAAGRVGDLCVVAGECPRPQAGRKPAALGEVCRLRRAGSQPGHPADEPFPGPKGLKGTTDRRIATRGRAQTGADRRPRSTREEAGRDYEPEPGNERCAE